MSNAINTHPKKILGEFDKTIDNSRLKELLLQRLIELTIDFASDTGKNRPHFELTLYNHDTVRIRVLCKSKKRQYHVKKYLESIFEI